jgi:hypothetical protein
MIKRKIPIGCSVALLLMIALLSCSDKPTSVPNNLPVFSGADSNWIDITANPDVIKWPIAETVRKSGTHVIIGPEGNQTDSLFNFGYAPQQSHISHVFWLHNGYDDSLRIISVSPG